MLWYFGTLVPEYLIFLKRWLQIYYNIMSWSWVGKCLIAWYKNHEHAERPTFFCLHNSLFDELPPSCVSFLRMLTPILSLTPPSPPSLNKFSLWCTAWMKRSQKMVTLKQVLLCQCAQQKTELFFLLSPSSGGRRARLRLLVQSSYVCLRGRSGYSISVLPWNQLQ